MPRTADAGPGTADEVMLGGQLALNLACDVGVLGTPR